MMHRRMNTALVSVDALLTAASAFQENTARADVCCCQQQRCGKMPCAAPSCEEASWSMHSVVCICILRQDMQRNVRQNKHRKGKPHE